MKANRHFSILHKDKKTSARVGFLNTNHGAIETPVFMPVATQAVFKGGLDSYDVHAVNAPIILANTYHLYLRPGSELIYQMGGLHSFMHWDKPILTDSGGFQVWSLGLGARKGGLAKIDDDGVTFTSHLDGRIHRLTPERTIHIQRELGADIIMAFDEATSDMSDYEYAKQAMKRTHEWAKRCLEENSKIHSEAVQPLVGKIPVYTKALAGRQNFKKQLLFGIMQGGKYKKLRIESAKIISAMGFDGIAVGGETIGYNMKRTAEILEYLVPYLPEDKPRYTMGLGISPTDFFVAVEHGIDMFDCVAPARIGRHGNVYCRDAGNKKKYRLNILNTKFVHDTRPLCSWCDCLTCKTYSRAYLRHLFKAEELTALRLATIHNLRFMLKVMEEIREAIKTGVFLRLKREWFL